MKVCNFFGVDFIRFWMFVEGRKKFFVFMGYFGNVFGSCIVIIIVSDLLNKLLVFLVYLI